MTEARAKLSPIWLSLLCIAAGVTTALSSSHLPFECPSGPLLQPLYLVAAAVALFGLAAVGFGVWAIRLAPHLWWLYGPVVVIAGCVVALSWKVPPASCMV